MRCRSLKGRNQVACGGLAELGPGLFVPGLGQADVLEQPHVSSKILIVVLLNKTSSSCRKVSQPKVWQASTSDLPGSTEASFTMTSPINRPTSLASSSVASIFRRWFFHLLVMRAPVMVLWPLGNDRGGKANALALQLFGVLRPDFFHRATICSRTGTTLWLSSLQSTSKCFRTGHKTIAACRYQRSRVMPALPV